MHHNSLMLGALPIEEFSPTEQDLQLIQAQIEIGPMNFLHGRIHKQISLEINNKGLCTLKTPSQSTSCAKWQPQFGHKS